MNRKLKWMLALTGCLMACWTAAGAENLENKEQGYSLTLPAGFEKPVYDGGNALAYNVDGSSRIQITVTPFSQMMTADELQNSLPAMEKEAVKNIKKNGTKIMTEENITAANRQALHVVSREKGKAGALTEHYIFFMETGMTDVLLTAKDPHFGILQGPFETSAGQMTLTEGWKKINIPGTSYTMAVPRNMMVEEHPDPRTARILIGATSKLLFSIAVQPAGENTSLPSSLEDLDDETMQQVQKTLEDKIKKESPNASDVTWEKTEISGSPALQASYDDVYGHGINDYVIKDGKCWSFEFSYRPDNEKEALPLVKTALASIDLGAVQEG